MNFYRYDRALRSKGFPRVAGIDEAGRGPLAGPVVAAAVILKDDVRIDGLRDSKKVPEEERTLLFDAVRESCEDCGIGVVDAGEIDRLNILQATKVAMRIAVANLSSPPDFLVIDAVSLPAITIPQLAPVRGESVSASVAAASIIAKVTRDRIMMDYHTKYPEYNFERHKGYSTKEHLSRLQQYGPCPIHRKSFCRVKTLELPF